MDDATDDDLPSTHPAGDRILKDVVAYVEVYSGRDNRSKAVCWVLEQLGARVAKSFTDDVTHVIFKEGSKRTLNKVHRKTVHLVSVLWIDSCKQKQQHVSERFFPAAVPDEKSTPCCLKKRKKAKSMQPNDVEEDLANSVERCNRKKRRLDLLGLKMTPSSSPRLLPVLAEDTQPRSLMSGMFTPVRLYISETPPNMKAKLEEIQKTLEESTNRSDMKIKSEKHPITASPQSPLNKRLFGSVTDADIDLELFQETKYTADRSENRMELLVSKLNKRPLLIPSPSPSPSADKNSTQEVNSCVDDSKSSVAKSTRSKRKSLSVPKKISSLILESRKSRRKSIAVPRTVGSWKTNEDGPKSLPVTTNKEFTFSDSKIRESDANSVNCNSVGMSEISKEKAQKSFLAVPDAKMTKGSENVDTFNKAHNSLFVADAEMEKGSEDVDTLSISKTKPQIKMKKKLLSLTDLNEPVETLVKPSKCSSNKAVLHDLHDQKQKEQGSQEKPRIRKSKRNESDASDNTFPALKRSCLRVVTPLDVTGKKDEMTAALETDGVENKNAHCSTIDTLGPLSQTKNNDDALSLSMSAVFDPSFSISRIARPRDSIAEFKPKKTRTANKRQSAAKNSKRVRQDDENDLKMSIGKKRFSGPTCQSSESDNKKQNDSRRHTDIFRSTCKPSLVMTSLHSDEQELVITVIRKLGGFKITNVVCENTTHLICGESRRTLNVMHGLARGCWLLRKEWVLESLQAGYWLNENPYEVNDMFPSAKIYREEKERCGSNLKHHLFSSLGPVFISQIVDPPRDQLSTLIKLCQGQVTYSPNRAEILIGSEFHNDKICLNPCWIFDCITEQKLLPMDNYKLSRSTRENSPEF